MANSKNPFAKLKTGFQKLANNPSFTLKEQLGYASGSFGNSMGQDMVGTFFTIFLTNYVGIQAAFITVIMVVTKIVTIVIDPIAGGVLDHGLGKSKRSATKPFLLLSPIPLAVTSVLIFVVPAQDIVFRTAWVFGFFLIYSISDAIYDMSLLTMSVRMSKNPKDRKNFYTLAQFASSLGTTLPGGVIPIFISLYSDNYSAQSNIYLLGAVIFGVLGLASMMVPYFTLKEKNRSVSIKKPKVTLNAKALLMNKPLLLLLASTVLDSIRQICYGALAYLYLETLNAFWLSTVVGSVSVVLSYIGIALVPIVGRKLSSRSIVAYSYLYSGICYFALLLCGYQHLWLVGLLIAISGFPNGMMRTAQRILLADSTEYMEWKTWKKFGSPIRSEGMIFAVYSMANKVNNLWKDLLLPLGLTVIGYVSATVINGQTIEATQSPETLNGIFYLVAVPGVLGNVIPGIIMLFDNYTGKRKEAILAELNELRAQRDAGSPQRYRSSGESVLKKNIY